MNNLLLKLSFKLQKLTFKRLFIITLSITTFLVIMHVLGTVAHAASVDSGRSKIDAFDNLTSTNGKWLSSQYRNNYYLDIKSLGITDIFEKGTNGIANILFNLMSMLAYICIASFYFCFDTNISDLFKNIINNMQESLRAGIFDNLFLVAFVFIAFYLVKQLLKRNTVEIFSQILKLLFIIVLSFLLTTETSAVITNSTEISKTIGAKAVVAINNSESTQSYASDVSGNLWYSLVHEPWLMMEADNKLTEQQQEKILSLGSSSTERQKYIDSLNSSDSSLFAEDAGTTRIAQSFIILLLTILKAGIILLIALIQIAFQVMAILCILLSMVALLLAMIPQLGGLTIVENLAKRIFETQLGIVVTTFMLALMTKMDSLIMIDFQKATNCGWLIALIIQTAIYVAMIVYRKKIFKLINVASTNIKSGHLVSRNFVHNKSRQLAEKASDAMAGTPGAAAHGAKATAHVIRKAAGKVGSAVSNMRGDEQPDNSSESSGPNLKDNLKTNSNENGTPQNNNESNGQNLQDNLNNNNNSNKTNNNNSNSEGNSNVVQGASHNGGDSPDIKTNEGNKLRSNSSKNNGNNSNTNANTGRENSNPIRNKNAANTSNNSTKQEHKSDESRPNSNMRMPNNTSQNSPKNNVGGENLNLTRDKNTATNNTAEQDSELKESRPNLRNNLSNNIGNHNENTDAAEKPFEIEHNSKPKMSVPNNSNQNSPQNSPKNNVGSESTNLTRDKNTAGNNNTNQDYEPKESKLNLRSNMNNNKATHSENTASNQKSLNTSDNSRQNTSNNENLRHTRDKNNEQTGTKNNVETPTSENSSPQKKNTNIKPRINPKINAKVNAKVKADNSNKKEAEKKVKTISKPNRSNK